MYFNLTKLLLTILLTINSFGIHLDLKGELYSQWLGLLYYEKNWFGGHESSVISPEFFLAENGKTNPREEFNQTIASFNKSQNQCRFIGRYTWVKQNFSQLNLPEVKCKEYEEWTDENEIESLSLVFATGYLGNPASFFGHPLFKLNWTRTKRNYLLDRSVNYGAIVPEGTGGMMYLLKGFFGGFDASYSSSDFYYVNHNYGENELRDLWEYKLNLTDKQKELFLAHLFELQRIKFPYLFASKNCGHRVGLFLENISGERILNPYGIIKQPITVVENLERSNLIVDVKLIPSRQTRFSQKFDKLNSNEKKRLSKIIEARQISNEIDNLSQDRQRKILDTLIEYIEFVKLQTGEGHKFKAEVLEKRLALDKETSETKEEIEKVAPHRKQKSSSVSLGIISDDKSTKQLVLNSSAGYYNWLSPYYELHETGELSILDFSLLYKNKKVSPQKVTIFKIKNLGTSQTGLEHDGGILWNINLGLDNTGLIDKEYKTFGFQGGVGKAYNFKNILITYIHTNAKLTFKNKSYGSGYAEVGGGFVFEMSKSMKANLEYNKRLFENGDKKDFVAATIRLLERRDFDFSINYAKFLSTELGVVANLYW